MEQTYLVIYSNHTKYKQLIKYEKKFILLLVGIFHYYVYYVYYKKSKFLETKYKQLFLIQTLAHRRIMQKSENYIKS